MRRFRQLLSEAEAKEILSSCSNGILSLTEPDGTPYGVPVSYAYDGFRQIYFHSAVTGHKLDCIAHDCRCSFCVVGQDVIVPEKFTSYFRSVIVRGTIKVVKHPDEMLKGLQMLCDKYSPGIDPAAEISRCFGHVAVLRLDIEDFTGKEAIELVNERKDR